MMLLRRTGIFLLVAILITCLRVAAQDQRTATDTTVSDTIVVGAAEGTVGAVKSDSTDDRGVDAAASANDSLGARTIPDSVVRGWKTAPVFAYANDPRYWKREPQSDDSTPSRLAWFLSSDGFRWGIYIILGALLLYAIGRIVTENQLGIFYRGAKRSGGSGVAEAGEPQEEEDIDRRLQQSIDDKDYPQAVRYSYLRTLRKLDERGLIHYHARATDQEYLHQLSGTRQETPFRYLTNAYEKVCYGHFGLTEETFRRLFGYFTEFDKTLPG